MQSSQEERGLEKYASSIQEVVDAWIFLPMEKHHSSLEGPGPQRQHQRRLDPAGLL